MGISGGKDETREREREREEREREKIGGGKCSEYGEEKTGVLGVRGRKEES